MNENRLPDYIDHIQQAAVDFQLVRCKSKLELFNKRVYDHHVLTTKKIVWNMILSGMKAKTV